MRHRMVWWFGDDAKGRCPAYVHDMATTGDDGVITTPDKHADASEVAGAAMATDGFWATVLSALTWIIPG